MGLKEELIEYAKSIGADKIGVADASLIRNPPQQKDFDPENIVPGATCAISILLAIPPEALDLDDEDDNIFCASFGGTYVALQREINSIGERLVKFLEEKGYTAKYLGQEVPFEEGPQIGGLHHPYLHKTIAQIAGLGEEGVINMLVTPEFGPRVMIASIITNAPLEPDGAVLVGKVCKKEECLRCVEICPTSAISDENYPPYNFDRNRCFWGYLGGVRALEIDEPPIDWVEAKPNALKLVPEYEKKHARMREILEWDRCIGRFTKCTRCFSECPIGKEE
ncbi:MAG: 4Fe-4S binding protein [Candidatus Syntropharchaeia archaeon]